MDNRFSLAGFVDLVHHEGLGVKPVLKIMAYAATTLLPQFMRFLRDPLPQALRDVSERITEFSDVFSDCRPSQGRAHEAVRFEGHFNRIIRCSTFTSRKSLSKLSLRMSLSSACASSGVNQNTRTIPRRLRSCGLGYRRRYSSPEPRAWTCR
jgi:hypothetical protein